MITSAILNTIFGAITFLVNKLPAITTSSKFAEAIATGSRYIAGVYAFIPFVVFTILAIISFDVIFEGGYLLYKIIYWVIRRFPTQS